MISLAGRQGAMKETFGSTCHGAGRQMSRKTAIENLNIETVRKKMADQLRHSFGGHVGNGGPL